MNFIIQQYIKFTLAKLLLVFTLSGCNSDTHDIELYGCIIGEGIKNNINLTIENYYYEGGDYDAFYGFGTYNVLTDSNGCYSLKIDTSAYIQVYTKKGDSLHFVGDKYINFRKNEYNIELD